MIQIVLYRNLSSVIACSDEMQWVRGVTACGWRDKSADGRRTHVVGWAELLRCLTRYSAGSSHANANDIKSRSAIALVTMLVLPL